MAGLADGIYDLALTKTPGTSKGFVYEKGSSEYDVSPGVAGTTRRISLPTLKELLLESLIIGHFDITREIESHCLLLPHEARHKVAGWITDPESVEMNLVYTKASELFSMEMTMAKGLAKGGIKDLNSVKNFIRHNVPAGFELIKNG